MIDRLEQEALEGSRKIDDREEEMKKITLAPDLLSRTRGSSLLYVSLHLLLTHFRFDPNPTSTEMAVQVQGPSHRLVRGLVAMSLAGPRHSFGHGHPPELGRNFKAGPDPLELNDHPEKETIGKTARAAWNSFRTTSS
ncbi:hypothetical protein KM043_005950 [Ampulex compressa]|nr:hypothetical protein KM043_005950 [Ampulex compressa]